MVPATTIAPALIVVARDLFKRISGAVAALVLL